MRTLLGPVKSGLISEVSGCFNTYLYSIGTQKSVLIIEVFAFQGVHIEGFHCICGIANHVIIM